MVVIAGGDAGVRMMIVPGAAPQRLRSAPRPVERSVTRRGDIPLRFFLPTAEQAPDFGEHLPGVALLAEANVAQIVAEPQIKTQLIQLFIRRSQCVALCRRTASISRS